MKGLGKKVVALAAVATMAMTALTGCAESSFDSKEIIATVDDTKITAGVANFYLRYQQCEVEAIYKQMVGENLWITTVDETTGDTYADLVKKDAMESLVEMYIAKAHMDEYDVTISKEEKEAISKSAEAFVKANDKEALAKVSGEKKIVEELLELNTIYSKVKAAVTKEADREVSDEEAALKKMTYVKFATSTTSDDGTTTELSDGKIKELKKEAQDVLENAKAAGDLLTYAETTEHQGTELSFNAESTAIATEAIKAADALGEGEFAELIEAEDGFYVIQVTSLLDREATDANKKDILQKEKDDFYTKVYEAWKEEVKVDIKDKVLDKIDFQALEITTPAQG